MDKHIRTKRYIAVTGFTVILATFSLILYTLPLKIFLESFWAENIAFPNPSLVGWLIYTWFFWGAYKTSALMFNDKNEDWEYSRLYRFKSFVLVPLTPILDLKLPKDPFGLKSKE